MPCTSSDLNKPSQSPPESREEYEAFSLGYEAATGTRAPLQLPAPQNRSARDAFVADQGAMRSMEAMAVPNMARRLAQACGW